jgi:hypothetical protein
MLRCSTTSPVACEHKNWSLVNTRIPHYPLVSPWHGFLAIHWMLAVSPWKYSIAIRMLSLCGMAPSPSAHCFAVEILHRHPVSPWEGSLTLRSLAIAMGWVPTGRLPVGKLPRYPLLAGYIAVLSLCLCKETPCENSVGRLSSHCRTLAYIA